MGLTYTPISATTMADAKYVENHDVLILDICNFFGVPAYKVNAGNQSYSSNEQTPLSMWWGPYSHHQRKPIRTGTDLEAPAAPTSEEGLELHLNMMVELRGLASPRELEVPMTEIGAYSVNLFLTHEDMPNVPRWGGRKASSATSPWRTGRD